MFFYAAGLLSRWRFEDGTEACVDSPFPALGYVKPVCAAGIDLLLESLFETVSMASGFCSVVCVRGNAVFARSLRACRKFSTLLCRGKCSWNLLGFVTEACAVLCWGAPTFPQRFSKNFPRNFFFF
ncbi:hypothetical protein NPIL_433481 [Nephila pilipes]|uniref:Uncharacterized protein n=1 Tax=Nephila pilipes TaxID=299642 RepID=A0A8X6PY93_NEPPI|nr:hypothetical protein NPIL_433481 [Nephila pilipes]